MGRGNPKRNPFGVDNAGNPIVVPAGVTVHTGEMPARVLEALRKLREQREKERKEAASAE